MNAERLRELVNLLLAADQSKELQQKADKLESALNSLTSQPNEPSHQSEVVRSADVLQNALQSFVDGVTPAVRENVDHLRGAPFFTPEFVGEVRAGLAANALTPSVVSEAFNTKNQQRRQYVSSLQQLSTSLEAVGIQAHVPQPGDAELGVLLPRELFRNELEPLSKELHTLHRIIATFSEAALGSVEPVELREISTSDPVFFLGLNVTVIALMAGSLTWLLDTWERALKIKKIREEAREAAFEEDELQVFNDKAEKLIEQRVRERVDEILRNAKVQPNRRQELDTSLVWAHRALLARIERGVTIEVRALPPAKVDAEGDDNEAGEGDGVVEGGEAADFRSLQELAPRLEYPTPSGQPIIALPSADPPRPPRGVRGAAPAE